jgi:shikimate kinase
MKYHNISLIGFMASGKSTVGKIIADKMGMVFIDVDRVIELKQGITVKKIFENSGENFFRDIESEVISKLFVNRNCVFACGGGVIERGENMKIIKSNSLVFYLHVSPLRAVERMGDSTDRPLLNMPGRQESAQKLLKRRDPLYREFADIVIDTNLSKPEQIANEIIGKLK